MIREGKTGLGGEKASTNLAPGTIMVEEREATQDQTIAEDIVQEVHAKIKEESKKTVCLTADRLVAALEAFEMTANLRGVTTAHPALLRESEGGMTLEKGAGIPATMQSDRNPLLYGATHPLYLHPRDARMLRFRLNKQLSTKTQTPRPSSNHLMKLKNKSQITRPRANSLRKQTL